MRSSTEETRRGMTSNVRTPPSFFLGSLGGPAIDIALPIGLPMPDIDVVIELAHAEKCRRIAERQSDRDAVPKGPRRQTVILRVVLPFQQKRDLGAIVERPHRQGSRGRLRPDRPGNDLTAQRKRHRRDLGPGGISGAVGRSPSTRRARIIIPSELTRGTPKPHQDAGHNQKMKRNRSRTGREDDLRRRTHHARSSDDRREHIVMGSDYHKARARTNPTAIEIATRVSRGEFCFRPVRRYRDALASPARVRPEN